MEPFISQGLKEGGASTSSRPLSTAVAGEGVAPYLTFPENAQVPSYDAELAVDLINADFYKYAHHVILSPLRRHVAA